MNKGINNNGYDYVDLGLPSGTLWATMNVGASKPSDAGLYFQWGDTKGYTKDQVGIGEGQKKFSSDWSDYKWYLSGSIYDNTIKFSKYTTTGESLYLEDDAAHVNMGGDWHIPSPNQIKELIVNTISIWATSDDGVNGVIFASKKNALKSIFIPAVGVVWDGFDCFRGSGGNVWSSMLDTNFVLSGQFLHFNSERAFMGYYGRFYGLSIRGVIG